MIPFAAPYLPERRRLDRYLDRIYSSRQLTNNGPLVTELEERLADYLGVDNLLLVANGTLALQVAYRALDVRGSAVTSPFTFVATASSLEWQSIRARFADIDGQTLNLSPSAAESALEADTTAVVPVHVYGNPCDVDAFDDLARHRDLRLIYDASHAFGVQLRGEGILNWGDASTISFHATKVFHTVEGGAIRFARADDRERARKMINFGFSEGGEAIPEVGCNAKMSEFHAAMGLALLDDIDWLIDYRRQLVECYHDELSGWVEFPQWASGASHNGAYAPILVPDRESRDQVQQGLAEIGVEARSYFSPALTKTGAFQGAGNAPVSERVAEDILCLPLSHRMSDEDVAAIAKRIHRLLEISM